MQMRNKLAAMVNWLSKDDLANLSLHTALLLLRAVRGQPRTTERGKALKRLTMHPLRDIPRRSVCARDMTLGDTLWNQTKALAFNQIDMRAVEHFLRIWWQFSPPWGEPQ